MSANEQRKQRISAGLLVAVISMIAGLGSWYRAEYPRPQDPVTQPLPVKIVSDETKRPSPIQQIEEAAKSQDAIPPNVQKRDREDTALPNNLNDAQKKSDPDPVTAKQAGILSQPPEKLGQAAQLNPLISSPGSAPITGQVRKMLTGYNKYLTLSFRAIERSRSVVVATVGKGDLEGWSVVDVDNGVKCRIRTWESPNIAAFPVNSWNEHQQSFTSVPVGGDYIFSTGLVCSDSIRVGDRISVTARMYWIDESNTPQLVDFSGNTVAQSNN